MKRFRLKSIIAPLLLVLGVAMATVGCKKDDDAPQMVTEGVVFEFAKSTVYGLPSLDMIASVKIKVKQGGKLIELPSVNLSGDDNIRTSEAVSLSGGDYKIVSYKAYDASALLIFKADMDEENDLVIEAGKVTTFVMPFKIKIVHNINYIKNALIALCIDVFGEDESLWPWNVEDNIGDWKYLEFEVDDFDNIIALEGLVFDGEVFGEMTKLPGSISSLLTVAQLTFNNMPNLKELPSNLNEMNLLGITMINCGLESFPANFFKQQELANLTLVQCKLKEIPAEITQLRKLYSLDVSGNQITSLPAGLGTMPKLANLVVANNPISSLNESVFGSTSKINHLSLANTELSTLPTSIASMNLLRGINLSGCKFTSVPTSVSNNTTLAVVWLDNNKLASVSASDFSLLTNLEGIYISGNSISSCPKFTNANLLTLDVSKCKLSSMPDISALTNLRELKVGGNNYSSLINIDLSANKKFRILSLEGSENLISLPQNFGFEFTSDNKLVSFAHINVGNCPKLVWKTPASWNCVDVGGTIVQIVPDIDIVDPYLGRVSIYRKGSSGVQIGQ